MAVVFSFLIILVLFMNLVAKIIHSLGWDVENNVANGTPVSSTVNATGGNNAATVAAVTAAVDEYRKSNS
jgi:sodium pump decarboxylase gamma subunit